MRPTIVFVHGAFAESARCDPVTDALMSRDHRVVAPSLCADVPSSMAELMAETQRPITQGALAEASGERPLWRARPPWFLFGADNRSIPVALHRYMAGRAHARRTVEIPGASHAIAISQPNATAQLILQAAALPIAA